MRVNNYVIDPVSYFEAFLRNRNNDTVTTTKPNGLFWTLKTAPNSRKNERRERWTKKVFFEIIITSP